MRREGCCVLAEEESWAIEDNALLGTLAAFAEGRLLGKRAVGSENAFCCIVFCRPLPISLPRPTTCQPAVPLQMCTAVNVACGTALRRLSSQKFHAIMTRDIHAGMPS